MTIFNWYQRRTSAITAHSLARAAGAAVTGLAVLACLAMPADAQSLRETTENAIDVAVNESIASGWVAGGAVAVMWRGEIVFARGYGLANIETGTPARADSVFRIGSLTKQFTAAALLMLAEDGKLSLDDRVNRYLPEVSKDDPSTIRQLLNHTAGFTDYVGGQTFDRIQWLPLTSDELVTHVLSLEPTHQFPPGTGWAYSSSNYILAGAVIEKVSGQPLREFMAARIFRPLGMTRSALDDDRALAPGRASGYDRLVAEEPGYVNARTVSLNIPFAAGAMRSTVGDLLIWSQALSHGQVLRDDSYRQMLTAARLNDGARASYTDENGDHPIDYALGVAVTDTPAGPVLSHDGAIDGFTSSLTIFTGPDLAVAILVNTSPSAHLPFDDVMKAIRGDPAVRLR